MTAFDRIIKQATDRPHAVAVVFGSRSFTFKEIVQRSEDLADRLAAAGAGKGRLVAVALPRSADIVTSILAIFKIGAIYTPLDSSLPQSRLAAILHSAQPECLITDDTIAPQLPFHGPSVLIGETSQPLGPMDPNADARN